MTVNTHEPSTGTMDVDEFMAFMETRPKGEHWDLIEGVAVMMASANYLHQRVASNFRDLLNRAFATRGLDLCVRRRRCTESWGSELSAGTGCGGRAG
jgi:hypothetical protein